MTAILVVAAVVCLLLCVMAPFPGVIVEANPEDDSEYYHWDEDLQAEHSALLALEKERRTRPPKPKDPPASAHGGRGVSNRTALRIFGFAIACFICGFLCQHWLKRADLAIPFYIGWLTIAIPPLWRVWEDHVEHKRHEYRMARAYIQIMGRQALPQQQRPTLWDHIMGDD